MSNGSDNPAAPENILYERKGSAIWITLNRPDLRNALDMATTVELASALRRANRDDQCRSIVLTGAGENFCGGGDVSGLSALDDFVRYSNAFAEVDDAITSLRKPLIARVRGRATAGGMALTILADVAVVLDDTVFGTPEVALGMFPLMAMGVIAHEVGQKECWKMFYSGELFGTDKATELGIISEVAKTPDELDARIDYWVDAIEKANPLAISVGRDLYYKLRTRMREQWLRMGGDSLIRLLELRDSPLETPAYLKN